MGAKTELSIELEARGKASEAFHAHPSNLSSCEAWLAQTRGMHRRCPCEDGWQAFADSIQEAEEVSETFKRR